MRFDNQKIGTCRRRVMYSCYL